MADGEVNEELRDNERLALEKEYLYLSLQIFQCVFFSTMKIFSQCMIIITFGGQIKCHWS